MRRWLQTFKPYTFQRDSIWSRDILLRARYNSLSRRRMSMTYRRMANCASQPIGSQLSLFGLRVDRHFSFTASFSPMDTPTTTNSPTTTTKDAPTFSHHEHHQPDVVQAQTPELTRLGRYRQHLQVYLAEFIGTMLLVIFGTAANCQVNLSSDSKVSSAPKGNYTSVGFGFAVGISLGVWVSAKISGGHINPAVTIALATYRGFPWRRVPGYIFSQLMGGLIGAAIVYANYFHAIDIVEGRGVRTLTTAGNFGTYPLDYMTNVSAFFSEFLGTAILVFIVFTATDPMNAIPSNLVPVMLFVVLLGIALCLGMETGFAVNPARDLGPRLLTSMVGYGGAVYSFRNQYWLWGGVMASVLGGLIGALFYEILLSNDNSRITRNAFIRKRPNGSNGSCTV
ncbi:aquaporin [Gymnopus androsaceus JB14]|uniref:Aquaporin n=1 Tax=Gymnopus androsaceus JB14 TaxID=1447944 RepID=A0A6A4HCI8_9AGAR|nr:aquaporin [Gymnopus androsaceus JB14]